jgi:hypothetical protein
MTTDVSGNGRNPLTKMRELSERIHRDECEGNDLLRQLGQIAVRNGRSILRIAKR